MTAQPPRVITPMICDHHARACRIARYAAGSADLGLNRSTLYEASCTPKPSDTSSRKRVRSFRPSVRQCAWTRARINTSAAEASGNSGTGSGSSTTQRGRANMNRTFNSRAFHPVNDTFCRGPTSNVGGRA